MKQTDKKHINYQYASAFSICAKQDNNIKYIFALSELAMIL
jgi:hypothetical protein